MRPGKAIFMLDPYDTWEKTDAALVGVKKVFEYLHKIQPDRKKAPQAEIDSWDMHHKEAAKWGVSIHKRRIDLNIKELQEWRCFKLD